MPVVHYPMFDLCFEIVEDYAWLFIQRLDWELRQRASISPPIGLQESIDPQSLLSSLTVGSHAFLKWMNQQPSYLTAVQKFSKKKLARSLFFEHGATDGMMSKKTVLDGILALALVRYRAVEVFGADFFIKNPKKFEKLMRHSKALLKLLRAHEATMTHISEDFFKTLEHLSHGFIKPSLAFSDSKTLININHPKAAREIFILELCALYIEHFVHSGGTTLQRPHVDIIFEMTQLLDPLIDRRVIDDHLSRQQFRSAIENT